MFRSGKEIVQSKEEVFGYESFEREGRTHIIDNCSIQSYKVQTKTFLNWLSQGLSGTGKMDFGGPSKNKQQQQTIKTLSILKTDLGTFTMATNFFIFRCNQ